MIQITPSISLGNFLVIVVTLIAFGLVDRHISRSLDSIISLLRQLVTMTEVSARYTTPSMLP